MPNKLSQFWHELKRRNVTRVLAVYIAAAFMILELVDMTSEPFGLPDWSMKVAFIILLAGLIIAVIVSWIYDIHPEGGMVKTEPTEKVKSEDVPKSSSGWKIATYISFIVILGLIVLNVIPRKEKEKKFYKSIAVLPFQNFSGEPDQDFMCFGLTDEIINHLFKIESFDKVISLSSVLTYQGTDRLIPEIAQELDVVYILEGTYKKSGTKIKVTAQLIDARSDKHIWQREYNSHYGEIISIQADIAMQIADNIDAFITTSERQSVLSTPTTNIEAYNLLQKASYLSYTGSFIAANQDDVLELLYKAIELDPYYADAYARIGLELLFSTNFGGKNEPLAISGDVLPYFNKALEIDPRNLDAHSGLAMLNDWIIWDFIEAEDEFLMTISLQPNRAGNLSQYGEFLLKMNRLDEAEVFFTSAEPRVLLRNSYREIRRMIFKGEKNNAYQLISEFLDLFKNQANIWIGEAYTWMEEFDSVLYYMETVKPTEVSAILLPRFQACMAISYNKTKQYDKANDIISRLIEKSDTTSAGSPDFFIGWYYSGIGEVDSAFYFLEKAYKNRSPEFPWFKVDPVFSKLKDDDRYWDLYERTGHKAYDDFLASRNK